MPLPPSKAALTRAINAMPFLNLPASPEHICKARRFALLRWQERAAEVGRPFPITLDYGCKYCSLFTLRLFGGKMEGNWHHQYIVVPGVGIVDLLDKETWGQYQYHDSVWWFNPDHRYGMESIIPTVEMWLVRWAECE